MWIAHKIAVISLAFGLLLLLLPHRAHAEAPWPTREFRIAGAVQVSDGPSRTATWRVACTTDPDGGVLAIELVVPEAAIHRDFDYEDFAEVNTPARTLPLGELAWSDRQGTVRIEHSVSGEYVSEPHGAFRFAIRQPAHHRAEPARLLAAIHAHPGTLVWSQTAFDDPRRKIIARFVLDAAAVANLHDVVAPCLPQNLPRNEPRARP
jgi:hypothetical protein